MEGKQRQKKEKPSPDWQVAGLISKRTYVPGLPWVATWQVTSVPTHQNLKSLYRGLNLVGSHNPPGGGNSGQNGILHDRGVGGELPITWIQPEVPPLEDLVQHPSLNSGPLTSSIGISIILREDTEKEHEFWSKLLGYTSVNSEKEDIYQKGLPVANWAKIKK